MTNKYGPWTAYNGGGMPEELRGKQVQTQARLETRVKAEVSSPMPAENWYWGGEEQRPNAIIAYRVLIEPRAPREMWRPEFFWGLSDASFDTKQMCEAWGSGVRGVTFIRAVRFVETPE